MEGIPLELNHQIMVWFCSCPVIENDNRKKFFTIAFIAVVFTLKCTFLIAAMVYIFKFIHSDVQSSLHAILLVIGTVQGICTLIFGIIYRSKINSIFMSLQVIHDASECS